MSDTTGWEKQEPWTSPGGKYRFDKWTKNINTGCSGIVFEVMRVRYEGIDTYTLNILDVWCSVAERKTLRECQILAHDTARLWAGESE